MGEGSGLLDQSTRDLSSVTQALGKAGAGYGVARVPAALDMVAGTLSKMTESSRQVVIMTDLQRVSFPPEEGAILKQSLDRLRGMEFAPTITLWDVGTEAKDNVAIESLDFSKLMVGVGQKIQIRANLRNFGETAHPDLRVTMKIDGKEKTGNAKDLGAQQISLGGKSQTQVLFTHVFDKPGSHVVEIQTDGDSVQADNSYLASIPVRDKLTVLLVDGAPGVAIDDLKGEHRGVGGGGLGECGKTVRCATESVGAVCEARRWVAGLCWRPGGRGLVEWAIWEIGAIANGSDGWGSQRGRKDGQCGEF